MTVAAVMLAAMMGLMFISDPFLWRACFGALFFVDNISVAHPFIVRQNQPTTSVKQGKPQPDSTIEPTRKEQELSQQQGTNQSTQQDQHKTTFDPEEFKKTAEEIRIQYANTLRLLADN